MMMPSFASTNLLLACFLLALRLGHSASPVFSNPNPDGTTTVSIDEDTGTGVVVLTAASTDADGGTITYSITSQTPSAKFTIAGASISTSAAFDYETVAERTFTITVQASTDSDGSLSTATFVVNINDVNDETPQVTGGTFTANLDEEEPTSTAVGLSVLVTDADAGDILTYSITGDTTYFQVDSASGAITTNQPIDYETVGATTFSLTLTVKDSATPAHSVTQAVTVTLVDQNDNSPVFNPATYYATVAENTAQGTSVKLLTVTDDDAGSTITVSIFSGDDTAAKFAVNGKRIETSATAIDYEAASATKSYTLVVHADDTVNTATATVIVTITGENEFAPAWGTFSPAYVAATTPYDLPENSGLGITIVTVAATDADDGTDGTLIYTITSITNSGSGVTSGRFNLDQVTGVLTTTSTSFDRDPNTGGNEYYDLVIRVTDQGGAGQWIERTVRVGLTDYNDNTPAFSPSSLYTHSMSETTTAVTALLTVLATDDDVTHTLTYSLETSSTPSSYSTHFELDATNTNQINLKADVNLDSPDNHDDLYTLYIKVVDGGTPELSSTATVVITVTANNDHTPIFTTTPVTQAVDETATVGTLVATMAATDLDTGSDGDITYSISAGNTNNKFTIDSTNGEVRVAASLDFETQPAQYTLVIFAIDGATVTKTGTGTLTVNINDISDETPSCTTTSYSQTVPETTNAGDTILTLACTDDDAVDTLAYSITFGNTGNKFGISQTGVLTLDQAVDYDAGEESFQLTIQVTDGTTQLEIPVDITIGAVNEATPTFAFDPTISLTEAEAVGYILHTYAATDTDASPHDVVTYTITGVTNSGSSVFSIDQSSGAIRLAQGLDYESQTVYEITVEAEDGGGLKGTGTVTVSVTDVNDVTPSCTTQSYVLQVDENTAVNADIIADLQCSDADSPTLTYNTVQTPATKFSVDTTGTPKLVLSAALDYETTSAYQIQVTVSDGSLSTIIYIDISVTDINDGAPTFTQTTYTQSISESTGIGTSIATIAATDPDSATSDYGKLAYTFLSGNTNNKFNIDPSSGKVSVAGTLDADTTPSYNLVIQAQEASNDNSASATLAVTVTQANDNSPTCSTGYVFSESFAEEGTANDVITTLTCTDGDGDTLTYTLTNGGTYFQMNTNVLELKNPVDYDTAGVTEFQVTIEVSDGTNTVNVEGSVTVTSVNEHTPAFTQIPYSASHAEDSSPGTTITTISATDADSDASITYQWVTAHTVFTLDQASGVILLAATLDREVTPSYNLLVTASDGANTVTSTVTVTVSDVNDNAPVFNPKSYSGSVVENAAAGSVLTVTATDSDDGASSFGTVAYRIASGGSGLFSLDSNTGELSTTAALDYETSTSYTMYVEAYDSNGGTGFLSSTAVVTVTMTPVNEFDPTFQSPPYSATTAEGDPIGTSLLQVVATDADDGDDGSVYYSMSANANFYLDTTTGEIYIKQVLDYESGTTSYTFDVVAHDSGGSPRSATTAVTITVTDVNDIAPTCNPSLQTVSFQEITTTAATTIASFACSDGDTVTLSYGFDSINGAPSDGTFAIDSTTGDITLATALDYETTPSYDILVSVSDGGTPVFSTTATVKVTVTDRNENAPVFNPTTYTTTIPETTTVGTNMFTVTATDTDIDNTVMFSINPASSVFAIDSVSGVVVTTAAIDYDTMGATKEYELVIFATDDGTSPSALSSSVTATVTITDSNDNTPIFSPGVYTALVSENDPAGTVVTTVTATDSEGTTPTYSLANDFTIFQVNANGDIVINTQNQDYELTTGYALVVYGSDAASNTGTATVHITITNYNEFDPVLAAAADAINVPENTAIGNAIADVDATDSDSGEDGVITYTISTVTAGYETSFAIVPTTGVISVAGELDMESVTNPIVLVVYASDGGTDPGVKSAIYTLTVTITDENDNIPSCATSLYTVSEAEDVAPDTSLTTVACTDADTDTPNNDVSYSFVSGNGDAKFSIDSTTGEVTIATGASLDRETTVSYLLVVEATDGGTPSLTGTTTVTVIVTDVNDNDPVFQSNTYTFTVSEDVSLSTSIGKVSATDLDTDLAGSVYYSIFSGNSDSNMAIDSNTGELTVIGAFDWDTRESYILEVNAIDRQVAFRTGTTYVTITVTDVNDITPSCTPALQTVTFAENTALTTPIATVACSDSETTSNFGVVTYSIVTVDGVATTTPFAIVSTTGVITLSTALDYEADTSKTIVVHAIDGGGLTGSATVEVVVTPVNEHDPTFTNTQYTQSVAETSAVSTSIFQVTATDQDASDSLTYTINPASTVFNIDPSDGTIYLIDSLDFETTPSYEITVVATDDASQTATATVTIAVTDANDGVPVFNPAVYIASVSENDGLGTTVTTVTATDAENSVMAYTFASGNDDSVFRIEATGEIIIDSIANLDYDSATKSYTLVVHGSDGTLTGTTTVAITVTNYNDNSPILASTSSTQTIDEGTTGQSIVTVAATDIDHGDDGVISYSISAGNGAGKFAINPTSGEVTLAGELDMESTQTYVLTIDATDGGTTPSALTAQYTLTVNVADINDVTPVCTQSLYSVNVAEDTTTTTSVLQLACSDSDHNTPNNQISNYNMVSGNTGAAFVITATGELQVNSALNRESLAAYTLVIDVIDGGTNPGALTTTTTVAITVTDVNDITPNPGADPYGFSVDEGVATGTVVGTVVFTDGDEGDAGTVTFSINSGNVDNKFEIDSTTGEIKVVADIDHETATANPYVLVVHGTDNDPSHALTGTTTVSITINDVNDNTPSCSPTLSTVQFAENTPDSTTIDTLACTDSDSTSPSRDLLYTIVSVNGVVTTAPFDIDAAGVVSLAVGQSFDYETTPAYRVLVRVYDGGTPSLSSTVTVNVDITDVNEAAPVFQSTPYTANVPETTAVGVSVYSVTATDTIDTSDSITYSINPTNTYFDVDPVTGAIYMIAAVDYDTLGTNPITLTVIATDNGGTPRTTSETVALTIADANDVTPSFNPGVYSATVAENDVFDTTVVTVTVTDADDSSWTMSFASGNDDSVFRVDSNGDIVINDVTNFDYDSAVKSYLLVVRAVDSGPNTGTTTVAIQVTSINEHTPALTATTNSVTIAENSAIGTSVDDVDATDADHGADGTITYSIASISNSGDGLFTVDPSSGLVTVSGALDREVQNTYTVTIHATDAGTTPGALTATYTLTVTVSDENDNTPACTATLYTASVAEDATVSTSVAQLTCNDADAEANNNVINTYNIDSGNTGTAFAVSASGEITTSVLLDRENLDNYNLVITVADSGTPPLTTTTTVTITVTDVNDNEPVFNPVSQNLNYDEDTTLGTVLGTVTATDEDIGDAGTIVFSIFSGDVDSKFTLASSSGDLVLTSAFDYETASNNPYTLIIHAVDGDPTPRTGTGTVIITVNDVNDNTPICTPALDSVSYIESTGTGTTLRTLNCNDADSGANAALTYTIVPASTMFSVDTSGAIRLLQALDYETSVLHTVLVEVKDGGATSLSTIATVNIDVTNDNDNTPTFSGEPYATNVIENTAIGTSVYKVTAADADVDDTVRFTINPAVAEFDIDPNNGDIILTAALNYDAVPNTYEVIVEAFDDAGSPLTATATVDITVTNFNDGTPEFDPGVYAITVSEDKGNSATVVTVTITDIDTADTTFTYNIISGDTDNIFNIIGTTRTADLIVNDNTLLNYEGTQSYSLIITASDGTHTGTATVAVEITGINEDPPVFAPTLSTENVPEDSAIDAVVIDLDATDADSGADGSLTYSILSGGSGDFAVNPSTGVVTVSGSLDVESTSTYTVLVQALDAGTTPGAMSATYTLNIVLTDVNDMTPVCTSSLYSASIGEDIAGGTSVAQLACTDADHSSPNNDVSSYTITSGNGGGEFLISSTGEVTTAAVTFDRETTDNYELVIEVADSGTNPAAFTTTTTLTIAITDVNDNTPAFTMPVYNIMIDEDTAIHTSIGSVDATDTDIDLAGSVVYSIAAGNGHGKFSLDRTTGQLTLADTVDYETTTTTPYVLTVHASDRQATVRTGTATVSITLNDINDNTPTCTTALYSASIAEDSSISTSVLTVTCTDADAISTVSYSTASAEFSIDSSTGQIDTAATLDVETAGSYDFTVTVSDGTLSTSVDVKITVTNVNDETPAFDPAGPYLVNIDENEGIGYEVFDVNATDGDISVTTFIFSITAGNTDDAFLIGASSGVIQLKKTIDRDDPLTTSYTLEIEVADGSGGSALTATTSIDIIIGDLNDNYPSCDLSTYFNSLSENSSPGVTIFTPTCSDLDVAASPTLLYAITNGNAEDKFQLNTGTGQLTLKATLDYETTISYTLTVTVDDQGTTNLITTIYMTIYVTPENEDLPVFQGTPYDASISESEALGYQVVKVSATDADTGSTHGDVRYAITSGNDAGHFSIDSSDGQITVAAALDRESTASYALTVEASDMLVTDGGTARTATNVFTVTIQDENDNYPVINPSTYATSVNENAATPASIVQIMATDDDEGTSGSAGLVYTISSGNTANVFSMSGEWVVLTGSVDAATLASYVLSVKVEDQGTPVRSSFTLVSVSITAINEHAPDFTVTDDTVTVSEAEPVGNSLYQVAASDADTGEYGDLRFYLTSGNTNNEFSVDLFNGDVRVGNSLDYDTTPNVYTLLIRVEDTANTQGDTQSSTFTLTVSLTDANDETPTFTMNTYSGSVQENVVTSTSVLTVVANDADSGVNSAITYSIVSGTGASTFSIDASAGEIRTDAAIDYESDTLYDLIVKAEDGGTPTLSATCLVRISVNDENDETPVFTVTNVAVSISEDTAIGTLVATATATDADSTTNNNNVIAYSFASASAKFVIGPTTGAITTTDNLDRDVTTSYTLTVLATDAGITPNTGTATYTILLLDVNDNDPDITGTPYDTTIAEDTAQNTIVFNILASDQDEDQNAVLSYNITAGNTDNDFFIDTGSGIIQVRNALDRETTALYTLEVTVMDSGTPVRSSLVSATVTVSDINDNSPIFQPDPTVTYHFSISENVPIGTSVDTVLATDADTGTNAAVQYAIARYITGDNSHFTLDASTGVISTAAIIDRETQDTYSFIVRASDAGTNVLTSTVTVSITLSDYNDNTPSFSQTLYSATTTENQPAGTSILTVVITDTDIDVNDDITLSINTTTAAGARADLYIALNSTSSILFVKQSIDRETDSSFNFVLIATDGGTPPLSFTTSIEITVGDGNDNNPVFSPTFYNSEIPYNDNCQITATTLTATDADAGVNAALTYTFTQNNNPHLWTLDSSSGAITIVATPAVDTGYIMYASAADGGSPVLSTATGATIRVDTYDPTERVLNYYMDISETSFLASEATFLSQLTTVYQQTYSTAQAKRWCTQSITSSSCVARIYVIKDDTADEDTELTNEKVLLTGAQAYAITAADNAGTPASVITGVSWTSFVITHVERYQTSTTAAQSSPWAATTTGVAVLSAVGVVGLIAIVAGVAFAVYKYRFGGRSNRVEVGDDDGGDHVAKNQFYPKHQQMQTGDLEKPLGKKTGLPPEVVPLPMPTATKKVPLQVNKPSPAQADFKSFNLLSPTYKDGPTLMKSPAKLRPSSPIMTNTVLMPRSLPQAHKSLGKPPAYTPREAPFLGHSEHAGPPGHGESERPQLNMNNREFNGRAFDPTTGKTYEYNTATNETRWVDNGAAPRPARRPTLTRDDEPF